MSYYIIQHIEAETNGRRFADDMFKSNFLNENVWFSINLSLITEVCPLESSQNYFRIGSYNGLAPTRRQAIIWTNDGLVWWCIYASLGLNELSSQTNVSLNVKLF